MQVISRDSIEGIESVEIDGQVHDVGIVKDFHNHPALRDFVPDNGRLSLSWVHLAAGQELAVHVHPTKSMIIVAQGGGYTIGDLHTTMAAGDIVIVPEGTEHGFVGSAPHGIWAISVQFEGAGLYETPDNARTLFLTEGAQS